MPTSAVGDIAQRTARAYQVGASMRVGAQEKPNLNGDTISPENEQDVIRDRDMPEYLVIDADLLLFDIVSCSSERRFLRACGAQAPTIFISDQVYYSLGRCRPHSWPTAAQKKGGWSGLQPLQPCAASEPYNRNALLLRLDDPVTVGQHLDEVYAVGGDIDCGRLIGIADAIHNPADPLPMLIEQGYPPILKTIRADRSVPAADILC